MALVRIKNETLVDKREVTYLTAAAAIGATSLTVVDNNQFLTDNDYYLLGEIGSKSSEIVQKNAAGTIGITVGVDAIIFAHPINTPLYRLDYNQYRLAHATSTTTASIDAANVATNALQFDDTYTRYQDSTYTTGYFFVRFYNSTSTLFSDYSAPIPVGGHTQLSLWEIARRVYKHLGFLKNDDMDESQVKLSEVRRALNDKQRDIVHDRLWTFAEGERSFSTVANQFRYTPDPLRVGIMNTVNHDSKPLRYADRQEWEMWQIDSNTTSSYATHFNIWNNEIYLWPKPSTAATTTAVNDAANMSATATSVTVDDTTGFKSIGGFYRFIIDSEVIYATATTSTTFTGLLRARENTTAAIHLDNATITERDIVYTYQVEPVDMVDITDETLVSEPDVLALGVASDFARGSQRDNAMADRLEKLYQEGYAKLIRKYSKKVKTSFSAVKETLDTVEGRGLLNPNNYPQNLTGA